MINEFSWVLKVLYSCTNELQINTSENLFQLFVNKHKEGNESRMHDCLDVFEKIKKTKLIELGKKYGSI